MNKQKTTWTKKEVEELCRKAMIQGLINGTPSQACMSEKMYIKEFLLKNINTGV